MRVSHELLPRRAAVSALLSLSLTPLTPSPAFAFKNALPDYEPEARHNPGPRPPDLGSRPPANAGPAAVPSELKSCLDGKPHCFSSSRLVNAAGGSTKVGSDWLIKPWTVSDKTVLGALKDIRMAVDAYPPGQAGIDGGGFKVVDFRLPDTPDEVGYIYIQFESLIAGYIDDVEFVVVPGGVVNLRTSSRLGFLDFGVNAKRLNWFAKRLGGVKGWKTAPIREQEHRDYFAQNDLTDADVKI